MMDNFESLDYWYKNQWFSFAEPETIDITELIQVLLDLLNEMEV